MPQCASQAYTSAALISASAHQKAPINTLHFGDLNGKGAFFFILARCIMPIHNCPFSGCDYATTDVSDQLATTLLQMHFTGMHPTGTPRPLQGWRKFDVRPLYPLLDHMKYGRISSLVGVITRMLPDPKENTSSCNFLNVARKTSEETSLGQQEAA